MNQETSAPTTPLAHFAQLAQLDNPIRNFSVQLSPTPRGARLARLLATEQLRSWGLPLDPAAHVVAELAANAVRHGRIPGRDFLLLLYVVGDTLRIEVTDTCGDRLPHPQHPAPEAESGRGLLLVEAFANRWGFSEGPAPRKTVWAEVVLPPGSRNPCSGATGGLPQEPRR
ncbi:ATP-binding protein [Streptomyces sp. NPDC048581]|uniref:ATP-binding protein n=1 Tax=unclassified Streptomyces TaxID=2593676 RepID=UPI00371F5292